MMKRHDISSSHLTSQLSAFSMKLQRPSGRYAGKKHDISGFVHLQLSVCFDSRTTCCGNQQNARQNICKQCYVSTTFPENAAWLCVCVCEFSNLYRVCWIRLCYVFTHIREQMRPLASLQACRIVWLVCEVVIEMRRDGQEHTLLRKYKQSVEILETLQLVSKYSLSAELAVEQKRQRCKQFPWW